MEVDDVGIGLVHQVRNGVGRFTIPRCPERDRHDVSVAELGVAADERRDLETTRLEQAQLVLEDLVLTAAFAEVVVADDDLHRVHQRR